MNISILKKCSNCGACYNKCPVNAIEVIKDDLFYNPVVNLEKCINCGTCVKICPVNNGYTSLKPIHAYAGWHKDESVLMKSSSGGLFYGIAQLVLKEAGVVYGAAYSNDYKSVKMTSSNHVELLSLQKSKYVESDVAHTFKDIKLDLDFGKKVLFCGTPCQVAGLHHYLKKEYENLLTCDFVCGGLPSHKLYEEYLSNLEGKYKSKIKNVDFRPKTHGWKRYAILVEFENGKKYNLLGVEDPFLRSFLYGKYTVRDYCLECKFSNQHLSDMTIADFWLHKKLSHLENEKGISLVVCNSEKGAHRLSELHKDYFLEEIDLKDALYNYKETITSNENIEKHDAFVQYAKESGIESACQMFFKDSLKTRIKNRIARCIFKG